MTIFQKLKVSIIIQNSQNHYYMWCKAREKVQQVRRFDLQIDNPGGINYGPSGCCQGWSLRTDSGVSPLSTVRYVHPTKYTYIWISIVISLNVDTFFSMFYDGLVVSSCKLNMGPPRFYPHLEAGPTRDKGSKVHKSKLTQLALTFPASEKVQFVHHVTV